jgi:fumarate reductase flavoprotein subunit
VANGDFYYQQYPASGSSLSLAITFGREAGKNAANEAVHAPLP